MKKKVFSVIFITACLLCCVIPFAGMIVAPSNEAIGNEQQTKLPSVKTENGSFNEEYLQQLGDYFSTHYALRPQIMSADAEIQSKVFGVSNVDTVTAGNDNWLFYSATLDNYLGRNLMSDRALFNTRHNLEITQNYLTEMNVKFLFTVAPNKNTLYSENMPYYYGKKESSDSNLKNFTSSLKDSKLNYCDLLTKLKSYDETLYLEQDSHWNNKGALIAYNEILDKLGKTHETYENAAASRSKNFYGDLGNMLYPSTQQPEYNFDFDINQTYSYVTPTKSVEEAMIATQNDKATGNLFMYRDSFGNALLPYFANAYNSAYFTKAFPINLSLEVMSRNSDTVVFEIAERNLIWFAQNPPVLPAREFTIPKNSKTVDNKFTVDAKISEVNMQYVNVSGSVDKELCKDNSEIIVLVKDNNGGQRAFEAFTTSNDDTDYGYQAYIPTEYMNPDSVDVSIVIKNGSDEKTVELVGGTVEDAVKKAGFKLDDSVSCDADKASYLKDGMTITLTNSIEVSLTVDGKTTKCKTQAETVKAFLEEQKVNLGKDDEVSPKLDEKIKEGSKVVVKRVEYKTKTEKVSVDYKTEEQESNSLASGETQVTQEGVKGEKTVTYKVKYVDGKEKSKEKVSEKVTKEPVNKIVTVGTAVQSSAVEAPHQSQQTQQSQKPQQSSSAQSSQASQGKTVVSKQAVYDCDGSGHGYYVIKWSDGTETYENF